MTKQITYDPKITMANTQYNQISQDDMSWLLKELMRYLAYVSALQNHKNEDLQAILKQWYKKRTSTLPKGKNGLNSPETFIGGLLNNLMFGNQNDLSDVQMDAIMNISSHMSQLYDATVEFNLQPKECKMVPIIFHQRIFTIS